jgi:mono/diheme cytochrome c family protein
MRTTTARSLVSSSLIFFAGILGLPAPAPAAHAQTGQQFFESKVRPILVDRCGTCHGEKKQQAGLQLTTRAGAFRGGDNGPVLVPGDAARSRLIQAVRRDGEVKMPPQDEDKLSSAEIEALAQWVAQGAPWPQDDPTIARAANSTNH